MQTFQPFQARLAMILQKHHTFDNTHWIQQEVQSKHRLSHTEAAGNQKGDEDFHLSYLYCFSSWPLRNCSKYTGSVW